MSETPSINATRLLQAMEAGHAEASDQGAIEQMMLAEEVLDARAALEEAHCAPSSRCCRRWKS